MISIIIPIKTVSESNCSEHWAKKRKRYKEQKFMTFISCKDHINPNTLPCIINMTRIAPRQLDDDNLPMSMKWIRDEIADLLIPGKARGQADSDPRIKWTYAQEKGKPKEYSVKIEIVTDHIY